MALYNLMFGKDMPHLSKQGKLHEAMSLRADVYGSHVPAVKRRSVPGHKSFVSECPLATDVQAILLALADSWNNNVNDRLDDIPGKLLPGKRL
ncbi:hypothetical protein Tco_0637362 [Tanacetum coccineum]